MSQYALTDTAEVVLEAGWGGVVSGSVAEIEPADSVTVTEY